MMRWREILMMLMAACWSRTGCANLHVLSIHNSSEGMDVQLHPVWGEAGATPSRPHHLPGLHWPRECGRQRCNVLFSAGVAFLPAYNGTGGRGGVVSLRLLGNSSLEVANSSFASPFQKCQPLSHFYGGEERDFLILSLCLQPSSGDLHVLRFGLDDSANVSTARFLDTPHSRDPLRDVYDVTDLSQFLYHSRGCGETKARIMLGQRYLANADPATYNTDLITYIADANGGFFGESHRVLEGCDFERVELLESTDPEVLVRCRDGAAALLTTCASSLLPRRFSPNTTGAPYPCGRGRLALLRGHNSSILGPEGDSDLTFDLLFSPQDAQCVDVGGGEVALLLHHPNGSVLAARLAQAQPALSPITVCGDGADCLRPLLPPGTAPGLVSVQSAAAEVVVADLSCVGGALVARHALPSPASFTTLISSGELRQQCPEGTPTSEHPPSSTVQPTATSEPSPVSTAQPTATSEHPPGSTAQPALPSEHPPVSLAKYVAVPVVVVGVAALALFSLLAAVAVIFRRRKGKHNILHVAENPAPAATLPVELSVVNPGTNNTTPSITPSSTESYNASTGTPSTLSSSVEPPDAIAEPAGAAAGGLKLSIEETHQSRESSSADQLQSHESSTTHQSHESSSADQSQSHESSTTHQYRESSMTHQSHESSSADQSQSHESSTTHQSRASSMTHQYRESSMTHQSHESSSADQSRSREPSMTHQSRASSSADQSRLHGSSSAQMDVTSHGIMSSNMARDPPQDISSDFPDPNFSYGHEEDPVANANTEMVPFSFPPSEILNPSALTHPLAPPAHCHHHSPSGYQRPDAFAKLQSRSSLLCPPHSTPDNTSSAASSSHNPEH